MSGILRLESLTKGNTLKQGDKTPLKYRLFDADGEKLNITGKSATVRLVYPDFLTIGYEKDGLTVAQDDTVTFTIDSIIPSRIYHVEIIVDDQFIFPSRADESKFTVDKSSLGAEANIIEIIGVDQIVNTVLGRVDADIGQAVTDINATNEAIQQAEQERVQGYQEIQQIIEDGAIDAVPADGSIGIEKLSFARKGTNLYDPSLTKEDVYYGWAGGDETEAVGFLGSGLIPVEPNEKYFIRTARFIVFYKLDGSYASGVSNSTAKNEYVVTTPPDAGFMRISWNPNDNPLPQQVNKGDKGVAYEPYRNYIPSAYVEAHDITPDDIPPILIENLEFSEIKSNLFDKKRAQIDKTVSNTNGSATTASRFVSYENMPVEAGKTYIIKSVRSYAWKTAEGTFISGSPDTIAKTNAIITAPATADLLSFSWYPPSDSTTIDDQQVNEGTELLPYEEFGYYIPNDFLENRTGSSGSEVELTLSLPPEIFAVTGKEINIYFDNISSLPLDNFQVDITCSLGKQFSDKWTATPTTAGNHPITVAIYKDFEMVAQANGVVRVKDANVGSGVTRNALVIGDSTIAQDYLINHLEDIFETDQMTVAFKGTRGTYGETHNEGYAGWTVSDLRTSKQYQNVVHPFYNTEKNDFDYSYYANNQGYSNLDYVILCFGINDTFSYTSDESLLNSVPTTLADFDYIVNDIKSYDSNIKIGVCVTIPPNSSQDAFGEAYSTGQTQWRYKRNNALWTEKLISHFKGKTSEQIYLVPDNVNIDAETGFRDGVHPNKEMGDKQRADTFYYWLKSFE